MGAGSETGFEATVSPILAGLLAARRRAVLSPPEEPAPAAPPAPETAEAAGPPSWPRCVLRRDGARPLCFAGLAVLSLDREIAETEGLGGAARRRFRLFVTPERRLVAHLAVLPAGSVPARPIHRAAYLDDPADLARFLAANDPSDCAAVLPPAADGAADALWAGLRLTLPLALPDQTFPDPALP